MVIPFRRVKCCEHSKPENAAVPFRQQPTHVYDTLVGTRDQLTTVLPVEWNHSIRRFSYLRVTHTRHPFATHAFFVVLIWSTSSTLHFIPAGFIPDAAVIGAIHLQHWVRRR
jgi:hypothetical protein